MKIFSVKGSPRAGAIATCYTRLMELLDASQGKNRQTPDAEVLLREIEDRGLVYRTCQDDSGEGLYYLPSITAKETLTGWLDGADTKLRRLAQKALKPRKGALITFPLHDPSSGVGAQELHCFTTDWSPLSAACAIAVHAHHQLAPKTKALPAFTGAYVRHPLHGDLLPVWAVDWVAPDIGTGVVIVNPAHCSADLCFAREVGIPIRFGLVPTVPGADSTSWIEPPVIREGTGFRTGVSADGLSADVAADIYFSLLEKTGRAQKFTEHSLGAQKIGVVDPVTGRVELDSRFASLLYFLNIYGNTTSPGPWIAILDRAVAALDLACLVCLAADCGLSLPKPRQTIIVGATESEREADTSTGQLAYLSAVSPTDTLILKKEAIEQAERFIANLSTPSEIPTLLDTDFAKGANRSRKIIEYMTGGEPHRAFRELYKLQRDIKKDQGVAKADIFTYPALAYVLSGKGDISAESDLRRLLLNPFNA